MDLKNDDKNIHWLRMKNWELKIENVIFLIVNFKLLIQ